MSSPIPNVLVLSTDDLTNQLQPKRLRVSRACDVCRLKKVRCDGRQPCIHCTVYSYDCTYNPLHRSRKRSKAASQASRAATTAKQVAVPVTTTAAPAAAGAGGVVAAASQSTRDVGASSDRYARLLSCVFPELNLEAATADPNRFRDLIARNKFQGLLNVGAVAAALSDRPPLAPSSRSGSTDDEPLRDDDSSSQAMVQVKIMLPPRDIAQKLILKSWHCACVLFRFYHRPNFMRIFNSLYETNPEDYTDEQNKALPLIYSVIAVGALFSKEDYNADDVAARDFFQDEGYKYFIEAKKLIDVTNATDIQAIQTIFMLTIFLQCSAKLTTCYSYIGVALRSAMREGLHRKITNPNLSPVDLETKKRLFWTIYKMDVYMNCILGLPSCLSEEDVDQELPGDYDDDRITENGIDPQPWGKISSCGMNNEHTKLIMIMKHIYEKVYRHRNEAHSASLTFDKINSVQTELNNWSMALPLQLKPNYNFVDPQEESLYLQANKFLHLDYLHANIMLYRPFIHNFTSDPKQFPHLVFEISMAHNCIKTAQEIVQLACEMVNKKVLSGSYWFSVHTIFFSVACLIYFTHQLHLKRPTSIEKSVLDGIQRDLKLGIDVLLKLKNSSMASERTFNVLNKLFEKLNEKTVARYVNELDKLQLSPTDSSDANPMLSDIPTKFFDTTPQSTMNIQANLATLPSDVSTNMNSANFSNGPGFLPDSEFSQAFDSSFNLDNNLFFNGIFDEWDSLLDKSASDNFSSQDELAKSQ
ncbi:LAFE_0G03290g1_1 [Lachancea fermentati]|uniref:LAFE_0G03290g1_1 n=1 Tax=Lachancea fermentati TaxID=4955 RepID=A0A1G4MGS8_LACFM|nr:LAFE_0G03290g1_1 [Lachancea fermentati]